MKTLAIINMTQPRVAVGGDQSGHTTLHLLQGIYGKEDVELFTDKDAADFSSEPLYAREIGIVEIIHPAVVWGTSEEVMGDMIRAAYRRLEREKIIEYNDFGVPFLRAGAPAK